MIKIDDLPYDQFAVLGIKKTDIINLPPRTLNALLSGRRTSLIRLKNVSIVGVAEKVAMDAKMSLKSDLEGKVTLQIHPINKDISNTFDLTDREQKMLNSNDIDFVRKKIRDPRTGKETETLIFKDTQINDYVGVKANSITPPEEINNVKLSEEQKEKFANGEKIEINGVYYQLDPTDELGIKATDKNLKERPVENIRFKNGKYNANELLLDIALLTSGMGSVVMMGHLLKYATRITVNPGVPQKEYMNKVKNAVNDLTNDVQTLKNSGTPPTTQEAHSILEKKLKEQGLKTSPQYKETYKAAQAAEPELSGESYHKQTEKKQHKLSIKKPRSMRIRR